MSVSGHIPPSSGGNDDQQGGTPSTMVDKVKEVFGFSQSPSAKSVDQPGSTAGHGSGPMTDSPSDALKNHPDAEKRQRAQALADTQRTRVAPMGHAVGSHAMSHGQEYATPQGAYGTQGAYTAAHANKNITNYPTEHGGTAPKGGSSKPSSGVMCAADDPAVTQASDPLSD